MTEFMAYYVCLINLEGTEGDVESSLKEIAYQAIDFIRTNLE